MKLKQRIQYLKILLTKTDRPLFTRRYFIFSIALASYLGILIYYFYKNNSSYMLMSKQLSTFYQIKIPIMMRRYLYGRYIKKYGINVDQCQKQIGEYQSFSQFYSRKIKPRKQMQKHLKDLKSIGCPCDAKIVKIAKIIGDQKITIKGFEYPIGTLVFALPNEIKKQLVDINTLKFQKNTQLYQIVFQILPGSYHRFHSPTKLETKIRRQIQVKTNLSEMLHKYRKGGELEYQRVSVHCQYLNQKWKKKMYLGLIMVGERTMRNIIINEKKEFEKGEELGYFSFGSNVVMIIESKGMPKWEKKQGDRVRYGENLCTFN